MIERISLYGELNNVIYAAIALIKRSVFLVVHQFDPTLIIGAAFSGP